MAAPSAIISAMAEEIDVANLRRPYGRYELDVDSLDPDPMTQVSAWLAEAVRAGLREANAMVLATADADGVPSARTVLLKGIGAEGLTFYTNYRSRKARELAANPHAAVVLTWLPLERQVRVSGIVERLSAEESDAYFATRPRGSQLGAWASDQSAPIPDRATLEAAMEEARQRFGDGEIPRPPHWGGFRILPARVELWQGRSDRLHDRFEYRRTEGGWEIRRLSP